MRIHPNQALVASYIKYFSLFSLRLFSQTSLYDHFQWWQISDYPNLDPPYLPHYIDFSRTLLMYKILPLSPEFGYFEVII